MNDPKIVIIGGGLAGLSAGCYARASGFPVTIIEHNLALGGVCTAWSRGPYVIDGCIHWLTGGPFQSLYDELGIAADVPLDVLGEFATYRHARDGWEVVLRRDLAETEATLRAIAPEDAGALARLFEGAARIAELDPHVERPPELATVTDRLRDLWGIRHDLGRLMQFGKPVAAWADENVTNPRLRRLLRRIVGAETPAIFLQMMLGYLSRGWLLRPAGGTARFRDALIDRYRALGGTAILNTTVEEVLVTDHRATGVRLTDGSMLDADLVVSTASAPETVFRLLAGRYGGSEWKSRMEQWRLFQPIVLASFGVARPFDDQPANLVVDGIEPLPVGGFGNDSLALRIFHDPAFAPAGHSVVQAVLSTEYDWWATRGAQYQREKDFVAEQVLASIDRYLPGLKANVRMADVATPLSFWRNARSWRGAFEGWAPGMNIMKHVSKQLSGLDRFYLAGQWVEPGGGVPVALMSGRHVIELICDRHGREFVAATDAGVGGRRFG